MAEKFGNKCLLIYNLALLGPQKQIVHKKIHVLGSPLHHKQVCVGLEVITLLRNIVADVHCVTRWSHPVLARTNANYTTEKRTLEAQSQLLSQANGLHFLKNVQSTKGSEPT